MAVHAIPIVCDPFSMSALNAFTEFELTLKSFKSGSLERSVAVALEAIVWLLSSAI